LLSPVFHRRSDECGCSLENRMQFPLEVFDAVRPRLSLLREPESEAAAAHLRWTPDALAKESSLLPSK
jgi:anthraniloyl-CoA monooxygenase